MRKTIMIVAILVSAAMILATVPENDGTAESAQENLEAFFRGMNIEDSTWGPYTRLSYSPHDTRFPMIASNENDPGHVVVVFADNFTGEYDWYFTESFDSGASWSFPEIAVDPDFEIYTSEIASSAIVMDPDGVVHMSFTRAKTFNTNQPAGIYYSRYDGTSWCAPNPIQEDLSPGTLRLYTTDIAVGSDSGTIHVAYGSDYPGNDNGDTWYSKSTDGGFTWSTPVNINQDGTMDVGYRPSLCTDANGNVYKANDGGWPGWIWFRRSPDDGDSWNNHLQIGNPPYEHRRPHLMCDDSGGVYMVYMREQSGDYTLMYKYSTDFGSTWMPSKEGGYTVLASITGMGFRYLAEMDCLGFIHIAYGSTQTGVMETYHMKIDTDGNVVSPPEMITPDDEKPSYLTGLTVDCDHVYVATKDYAPTKTMASIDIDPNTLNLKSKGKWITCYIELPAGLDVRDIDAQTILLEDVLPCELDPKYGFVKSESSYIMDHDEDGILERMVKFDRSEVEDMLSPGTYNLKVTGELTDGTSFEGYSDPIRIISPP